jgi:hypothetical protein
MKADHFGGPNVPLHASDLRCPSADQLDAHGRFFATLAASSQMPQLLRRRWQELAGRFVPLPTEVAFIHEASTRADHLLETYFGESVVTTEGHRVNVHHGIMPKGDKALEVADFMVQAAGGQARHGIEPGRPVRRDSRSCSARTRCGRASSAIDDHTGAKHTPRPDSSSYCLAVHDVATFADVRALIRDPPEGPTASD